MGTIEAQKNFRSKYKHEKALHYSIYLFFIEIRGRSVLAVSTGIVFLAGSLVAARKILQLLEVFGLDALFVKQLKNKYKHIP